MLPAGNNQGFTLVELLAVLTILGVLAAVTLPILAKRDPSLDEKAAWVIAQLSAKRTEALLQGRTASLALDELKKQFEAAFASATLDAANPASPSLHFFPIGGSNGGRLELRSVSKRLSISIDPLTGEARILSLANSQP